MARRHASIPQAVSPRALHVPKPAPENLPAAAAAAAADSYSCWRTGLRFWLVAFGLSFFLFERATVFAAPSPKQYAQHPLHHIPADTHSVHAAPPPPEDKIAGGGPLHTMDKNSVSAPDAARPAGPALRQTQTDVLSGTPANIAYFIQVSENTVGHLPRLLQRLHHEKNVYAIHFDLKISETAVKKAHSSIRSQPQYAKNVHIMQSELITYRGISMLLNTINAMNLLLSKDESWKYFINLSGADYPLVSAETQRKLLGHQTGLNYFTFAPRRTWDNMAENRLAEVWYDESLAFRRNASIGQLSKLRVRNPLVDGRQFVVSHAEAWMVSSREFCDFVVRGDMARKMLVAFAYAVDSSEHYFASLAWNHEKYKKTIVPHSLRMIVWMHDGVLSGQHPYNVDEEADDGTFKFQESISKSVLFFARKFDKTSSKLMDYIDERSNDSEVVARVEKHLINKVSSREVRIAEL